MRVRLQARRHGRGDRGAAAVEFALIAPVLLLLLFGIISYGYMLSFRQAMSQAAAEGARKAAVTLTVDDAARRSDAIKAINEGLGSYGVECKSDQKLYYGSQVAGTCTVSNKQACSNAATATCVKVSLVYNYEDHPLIPDLLADPLMPSDLDYSTEVQVS